MKGRKPAQFTARGFEPVLKPAVVGSHGESLARLLKPGFHSGAIGKTYARLRRIEGRAESPRRKRALARSHQKLQHIGHDVSQFVDRELFALLRNSESWGGLQLEVADIVLLPNTIHLYLVASEGESRSGEADPLHLFFQNQHDRLVAKVVSPGWVEQLDPEQRTVMASALAGFYKLGGVDVVDELVCASLRTTGIAYRLRRSDIDVWAGEERNRPVHYRLRNWGVLRPYPSGLAKSLGLPSLTPEQLLFCERDLRWEEWVDYWENTPSEEQPGSVLEEAQLLLPAPSDR